MDVILTEKPSAAREIAASSEAVRFFTLVPVGVGLCPGDRASVEYLGTPLATWHMAGSVPELEKRHGKSETCPKLAREKRLRPWQSQYHVCSEMRRMDRIRP